MIDLHTHILPGIDDGVRTEDEAVEFARVAVADGVRTIVATPHCREGTWPNDRATVLESVARLRRRLETEGIAVRLEPGAEVHLCPQLVERVADGRAPTLADNRRTLLLELSLVQYPVELENLVFQLKLAGIDVLFAHPERIRYFRDDVRRYESVVRMGAYGQITTGSVLGVFGADVRDFTEELARKGWAHVLASDSHNVRGRPPILSRALSALETWVGAERARAMATSAPAALLAGREPELPPPASTAARRSTWLGRLFRRPPRSS
jgi:protein-tyrosine phosphatase